MAYLSEVINGGIPKEFADEASICCMCGEKISHGGMWAMQEHHVGICKDCANYLIDWYIDTLLDTQKINEDEDIENIKKIICNVLDRYNHKKKMKKKYNKNHM